MLRGLTYLRKLRNYPFSSPETKMKWQQQTTRTKAEKTHKDTSNQMEKDTASCCMS
ncbi:uncharacterized protein DS421_19g665710 [Arachis hypogaea]|uniref:Uncharacterized protein n=1 Tax=Arachis hypogaea TaxID=3818 RepID=A0A6B9VBJ1_ARAHY|nr:uncharacterized protein DS421_19g665710 [Arachis hypogaea]